MANDLTYAEEADVYYLEIYVLNPAYQDLLETASTQFPANRGCAPLTLSSAPTGLPGGEGTLTATTHLDLLRGEQINIYAGKSPLYANCNSNGTICGTDAAPVAKNTYTADVGAPGTVPYTSQAIVSATTTVAGGKVRCKGASVRGRAARNARQLGS